MAVMIIVDGITHGVRLVAGRAVITACHMLTVRDIVNEGNVTCMACIMAWDERTLMERNEVDCMACLANAAAGLLIMPDRREYQDGLVHHVVIEPLSWTLYKACVFIKPANVWMVMRLR